MVCPMCTKQQHGLCRYPASCSCQHRVASHEPVSTEERACCTVDEPCMAHSAEVIDCCSFVGCETCG